MYHSAKHEKHLDKVRKVMKGAGYSTGGQNHSMKKVAKKVADKEIHKHEKAEHHGKMTKLKTGGVAEGGKSSSRLDKCARGGRPKGSHVHVNVIVPQGKSGMAPGAMPPAAAAPMMPPRPPMAPPAPQGAPSPMGGQPPMRPPGMKKGGKVKPMHEEHGSLSGEGRLDKIKAYGTSVQKKAKGGKVDEDEPEGREIRSKNGRVAVD